LDEAPDKNNLEEGVCIFEKFECRSGLNEFSCERIKVVFGNGFKVLIELVSED
jgi:hypothetical protein